MNRISVAAVICAAGASSRFGSKKEYEKIKESQRINTNWHELREEGITVLGASVRAFGLVEDVKKIVIAVPVGDEANARNAIPVDFFNTGKFRIDFVEGGETRRASVYNALSFLKTENPSYVLIHDGARPFVSIQLIENLIIAVVKHNAAIPVMPITETPKEIDGGYITRHLRRVNTGVAQTPQAFKFPQILEAHQKAAGVDEEFTDDAEIWGRFCGKVAVIPGEAQNKKITFKDDL